MPLIKKKLLEYQKNGGVVMVTCPPNFMQKMKIKEVGDDAVVMLSGENNTVESVVFYSQIISITYVGLGEK